MRGDPNVEALSYKQVSRSVSESLLLSLDNSKGPCGQRVILREAEKKRRSRFAAEIKSGKNQVYDADLSSYFDTIPHDKLFLALRRRITDSGVLSLIRQWLKSNSVEPNGVQNSPKGRGTPQGGVISPLLSNIYLHWFETCAMMVAKARHYMTGRRYLEWCPSPKSVKKVCRKVKEQTMRRKLLMPVEEVIKRLNLVLEGWGRYFRCGYPSRQFAKVNAYARYRLYKFLNRKRQRRYRLKYAETYYGELKKLGLIALTRKRCCR